MRIHLRLIRQETIKEHNVIEFVDDDGYVYVEETRAIHGLAQNGSIVSEDLQKHLAKYAYYPTRGTPGLWKHGTRPISFTLVVDDF